MPLTPGQQLLHYRLTEQIGEGGMGVVWKALDTNLDREVAIKVLPAGFAGDAERLARFEREAKLLASLNHPNIAGVYGLHEVEGERFLAMEYIAGEDLAQRLARGPLPVETALGIARQVTEALEVAHDSGIIHRDLKPANVRLTPEGQAKVLDFGLAKGLESTSASEDPSSSPTMTSLGTAAGVILGTAAYMSPEQARGQAADRRSDVWSFGAMLFETLTGRRPFEGGTISDTMAAVLRAEPTWDRLPDDTPTGVHNLLRRCLNKDARRRMQSIAEARVRLEEAIEGAGSTDNDVVVTAAPAGRPSRAPWIVAALAILGCVAIGTAWMFSDRPAPHEPIRTQLALDPPMGPANAGLLAMPGGRSFIYLARPDGQMFLNDLSRVGQVPLTDTEGAGIGDLSPDGEWLVYFKDQMLRRMPLAGGVPISLAPVTSNPRGAHWASDGYIYYAPGAVDGIWRIAEEGGEPEQVTTPPYSAGQTDSPIDSHRWPSILPGNRALMYLAGTSGDFGDAQIELLVFDTNETRVLQREALYPRYLADGRIAFVHEGTLMTMPFDLERLEVTSAPAASIEGVAHSFGNGGAEFAVSDNGTLIYQPGKGSQVEIEMHWLAADGGSSTITGPAPLFHPRFSPDGKKIAFTRGAGRAQDIWIYDIEREVERKLTLDSTAADGVACWSPDGRSITFSSRRGDGTSRLYRMPADGSSAPTPLLESDHHSYASGWSSDGSRLLFYGFDTGGGWNLRLQRFGTDGLPDGESEIVAESSTDAIHGSFSPDDRFILYTSSDSGRAEIYLKAVDDTGRWQVSDGGATTARWGPGGDTIYYHEQSERGAIRRVEVSFENGTPRLGRPELVVEYPIALVQTISGTFDVHPVDGRFVVTSARWDALESADPILIEGWFADRVD